MSDTTDRDLTEVDVCEVILAAGLADEAAVAEARVRADDIGSRPETLLLADATVGRLDLARALASAWEVPFCDLSSTEWDDALVHRFEARRLVAEGWFPIGPGEGESVVVATASPPTAERRRVLEAVLERPVELHATTEWDVEGAVLHAFEEEILDDACLGLWRHASDQSARTVLNSSQRILFVVGLILGLVAVIAFTRDTFIVVSSLVGVGFLVSVAFKFWVCFVGARLEREDAISAEDVAALQDSELPMYTVLVPVFREANVVADLVANLGALDYPRDRLQILLLLEENDTETIEAAKASNPPATITFVVVPAGQPQTKPKACNVGLFFAKGEFLVIFDAEDRPDPDQLKQAVIAFRRGDDSMVCVQAALNYWNAEENALTRMFTLEYSFWFDYMLPGLDALKLPIPLGGTSNHFRTEALRRLGGWDPFNVTEDADLGIRASALGEHVGVIRSTTFEEANAAYGNFIRQRSRWIKGYMQTTLVHLRHPLQLVRTVGLRQALSFALLIGGTPLAFLCTPPLIALLIVTLLSSPDQISEYMPGWVLWAGLVNLLVGNALMVYVSMMGAFRRRRYRLVLWGLLNPVYWLLHAIAAYKALWQLVFKPHYWEKTTHGLSTVGHAPADEPVAT
ncbi:glycosyltransferase [Ilumatobacter nonamiensis]|uniref:glycosyltransferase n=1 Tax=Ilumatobacter nonamiensis TaxID=467093 RepID=UPI000344B6CC|nr:glycosyltransferase [Ilumatobacter nonamiensis]